MGSTDVGTRRHVAGILIAVAAVLVAVQLVAIEPAGAAESVPVEGTITDEDGAPIEDVELSIEGQETRTDENGAFALDFTYERRGVGRLVATHPAYETEVATVWANDPATRNVSMTLSIDEDAPVNQNGTLRGTVFFERGEPVDGATVELASSDGDRNISALDETGSDGVYELSVPPGNYTVRASIDQYSDVTRNVTISANVLRISDLQFPAKLGQVVGSVTDTDGDPIADATVAATDGEGRTVTDGSGAFSLWTMPGERSLVADADGFVPGTGSVDVNASEPVEQTFVLEPNETIEDEEPDDPDESDDDPEENESDESEPESEGEDDEDSRPRTDTEPAPATTSGPGYRGVMSLLGVFATTLLVLATVAFVRR